MNTREVMTEITALLLQVDDSYLRIAKEHGFTYNGLMMMYMVEEKEHLTQKQVCDGLYLSKSSVHSILESLMDKGLLTLSGGRNKKEKYIVMTDEGRKFMEPVDVETDRIENAGVFPACRFFCAEKCPFRLQVCGKLISRFSNNSYHSAPAPEACFFS